MSQSSNPIGLICPVCGEQFPDDVMECPTDKVGLVVESEETLVPGSTFADRFEIQDLLGEGGMGAVYKARHRFTGQNVAIKMLHRAGDKNSFRRFKQEGTALSAINHQNVASILDFGFSNTGQPYLVMEYVEGKSLSDLMDAAIPGVPPMPVQRTINVLMQVTNALEHAHNKGIVHRDLKPSNIMLKEGDVVKLVDFGVAKMIGAEKSDTPNLTMTGEVFGSPAYMSPEQCTGESPDARSDVYSLGCVMYELFTGLPPFGGTNTVETMWKQIHVLPEPFDRAISKLASKNPQFKPSKHIGIIVSKCLAKSPDERYQTMDQLREDLKRAAANQSPLHLGKFKPFREAQSILVKRTAIAVGITLAIAFVTVAAFAFTYAAASTFVFTHFLAPGDIADAQNQIDEAEKLYSEAVNEASKIPFGEGTLGVALDRLGTFYQRHGKHAEAEKVFMQAVNLRRGNFWTGKLELAEELNNLGYQYLEQNKYDQADKLLSEAISLYEKVKHLPHPEKFALCLKHYSELKTKMGDRKQSEELLARAKSVENQPPIESSAMDWFLFQK